jgi:hypothetical protein
MDRALYLIVHEVRGEIAQDIAQRWEHGCGKTLWITLSGQRAYPLEFTPLVQRAGEMMVRATLPPPHRQA